MLAYVKHRKILRSKQSKPKTGADVFFVSFSALSTLLATFACLRR